MIPNDNTSDIASQLAAPFPASEVRWKPQTITKDGKRALAIAYIDARAVIDRLDDVLGIDAWEDSYQCLSNGSVVATLRVRIGERAITKQDVGSPSDQPDSGDKTKAAFSDALKRAAVKLGIGRYLYRLKSQWVDWDASKRQFARVPTLPPEALPKPKLSAPVNGTPQRNGALPARSGNAPVNEQR